MPYFQRKPVETLADSVLANVPLPGLPSRGGAGPAGAVPGVRPFCPVATATGIVEQAVAVLASERPSTRAAPPVRSIAGPLAAVQSTQVSQLQEQVSQLVEQFVSLASRPPVPDAGTALPAIVPGPTSGSDTAGTVVEPAPVVAPPGPVAPGGTAQIRISLVNEDEQPAQIAFFSTDLVGSDGQHIPAARVSCQPGDLTLAPGVVGEVLVSVAIPQQTRCGVYSGLIRASKLDYLHAVLVVQVETP